jgi:hypothetical protein
MAVYKERVRKQRAIWDTRVNSKDLESSGRGIGNRESDDN